MHYKIIQRPDPLDRTKPGKFYCHPKILNKASLEDVAKVIEHRSSLTKGDIMNVLSNLVDVITEMTNEGTSVKLGSLGSFIPTFRSQGADSAEECSPHCIHSLRLSFRMSTEMRQELRKARFQKVPFL